MMVMIQVLTLETAEKEMNCTFGTSESNTNNSDEKDRKTSGDTDGNDEIITQPNKEK